MNYTDVLTRAWRITWKLKSIWSMVKVGQIHGAWMADSGSESLGAKEIWERARAFRGKYILLYLISLTGAILMVALIYGIILQVVNLSDGARKILMVLLICMLVSVIWMCSVWMVLANIAIIGEDSNVLSALGRSWAVIRANPKTIIRVSLILRLLEFVLGLLILVFGFIIVGRVIDLNTYPNPDKIFGFVQLAVPVIFLYLPILTLGQSIMALYTQTVWVLTFRRLTGRPSGSAQTPAAGAVESAG